MSQLEGVVLLTVTTSVSIFHFVGPSNSSGEVAVLTRAGIDFIDENAGGPGVPLRKRQTPKD
jgi:hypothetical protein